MEAEVDNVDGYRALADAVSAGDRDAARAAADDLLRPATEALGRLLALLDADLPDTSTRIDEGTTMTKPSPEIEAKARERLAADEQRIGRREPAEQDHRRPAYLPVPRRGLGRRSGGTPPPG